ncbi:MAG: right-handed parallel beta-helix repeat-containing protein [Planctomycetaceae bacterium]
MKHFHSLLLVTSFILSQLAVVAFAQDSSPQLAGAQPLIEATAYPSLQAAIDALPAIGGIVHIPAGEFSLTEPLRIPGENVHLTGAGPATVLKNTNTAGQPTIAVLPPGQIDRQATGKNQVTRWRVQISNLRLIGNEKSGSGIDALWVNEIFLHGLTITAHGGNGILLDNCYEDPRIADCLITYNKQTGVNLLGCHDIVVSANQFEENLDALHCIDSFNLCMTGNNLDDHLGDGVVIENT